MARRLRIQFPGARYHVINRGNLRHDIFATAGARRSFAGVTDETCGKFGWRMHAYIVMRNHFHFALENAGAKLGRGDALAAVDLRRQAVAVSRTARSAVVLETAGCANQSKPWLEYSAYLCAIARGDSKDDRMVRGAFSRDWAIGTAAWRKALAREHAHLALAPDLSQSEVKELQSERWERALESALQESGRSPAELASAPKSAPWKKTLARKLRDAVAPSHRWLAEKLCMVKPGSVRAYVHDARPGVVGRD